LILYKRSIVYARYVSYVWMWIRQQKQFFSNRSTPIHKLMFSQPVNTKAVPWDLNRTDM